MIERLDGFTVDGFGNVIPGEPQAGDVVRIDGRIEQRYTPPPPPPDPVPKTYTKSAFKEFCYLVLGTLAAPSGTTDQKFAAGLAAFGAINRAIRASDVSDTVFQVKDEYDKADNFDKVKTLKLLGLLNNAGILANDQLGALSASWENQS